ncbi:efflux RND transporter periplasmic adaptor subunit, partial [Escherichia coli]
MLRHALPVALPVLLVTLLSACGQESVPQTVIRPAMVVQPQPASALVDSYPGEVRARYEPELAFRIAGKVSKRMVDVGDRVKKDQALAELDPQDVRL